VAEKRDSGSWVLVSVSTASASASLRVQVWRRLRALGALYLQQSVCLLPERPQVRQQLRRLADRVRRDGGQARVLTVRFPDPAEEQALVAEMRAARDVEYAEVLERFPAFFAELETETARGRATYEEVEESEADLNRFRDWLAKIEARDYFAAPGGERARAELVRAADALAAFEAAALAAEEPAAAPPAAAEPEKPSRRRLRSVEP